MKDLLNSFGGLLFGASMFYGVIQLQQYNMFVDAQKSNDSCYQRDLSEIGLVEKIESLGLIIGEKVYCEKALEVDNSVEKWTYFSE
ncbi:MAG: hypothetical protein ISS01_00755 [Nanoarchaeota archaeon]|nr:hypothetical protein [Nanoarchaeota archaeon]